MPWLGEAPAPLAAERLVRNALRCALELLGRLGAGRAARVLLRMPGWQELADEAALRAARAGARLEPGGVAAAAVVAAVCGGAMASVLFDTWLMLPLALAALLIGAPALSARHAELRRREANATMPAVFRTLSVAMGAGMTLVQAAEYAGARAGGAVGEAFARLALRLRCGVATETALGELSDELHAPGAGLLSTALAISHRTGSPLQGLFQRSAALVERQGVRAPPCGEDRASQALCPRRVPAPCRDGRPARGDIAGFPEGALHAGGCGKRCFGGAFGCRRGRHHPKTRGQGPLMAMGGLLVVLASASAAAACLAAGSGQPRERLATIGLEGFLEKAGAAYVIGRLSADGRKAREKKEALARMPVMIDVVVLGLSAGLSFDSSLELYCSRYGDALSRELGHALLSWRMGAETRGEALERAASSLSVPPLARFGRSARRWPRRSSARRRS